MIYFFPKLYKTLTDEDMRFVKGRHTATWSVWIRVRKLIPGVWITKGRYQFRDNNCAFTRV